MKTNEQKLGELMIIFVFMLPISIAMGAYGAWLLTYCWAWFIVPFGIMKLGFFHAWGLMFALGFFSSHKIPSKEEKEDLLETYSTVLLTRFIGYNMIFLSCWILHFMVKFPLK